MFSAFSVRDQTATLMRSGVAPLALAIRKVGYDMLIHI